MEVFIVTAIIFQILFFLYICFKLFQISHRTKRASKSAEDNFHLNLFNTYEQNLKFREVHRILQLSSDNQQVKDLFSTENENLFEYLRFLNFASSVHSDEILRLETVYLLFNEQFDVLRKHKELFGDLIRKKYFYIDLLLENR